MNKPTPPGTVLVMGAGSVGCWVGGRLLAAGVPVRFVARPRVRGELQQHGLTLSDLDSPGLQVVLDALDLPPAPEPPAALVLLCVKTGATAQAARDLGAVLPAGTPVLSLQNGMVNTKIGAATAPALRWLSGMVPFNIAEVAPGYFHRGTSGQIAAQDDPVLRPWLPWFAAAGLPLDLHADLRPVQWAKLLLNLNNPVHALSGKPLREELLDRDCRHVLAALQDEALAAMKAAGIVPARLSPLPPAWLPTVLRLPTWIFRRLAAQLLRIDARAGSSMADDLLRGRPTEIDELCGAVVRLAQAQGLAAPLNAQMVAWLSAPRPATRSGHEMRAALGL